mmetsp:Transcript_4247/g.10985  ORF Transcript_4247/g.10985 Transcript_4247/m.10985 type:complete len:120 (-) Transcript_4247:1195-1554(-)
MKVTSAARSSRLCTKAVHTPPSGKAVPKIKQGTVSRQKKVSSVLSYLGHQQEVEEVDKICGSECFYGNRQPSALEQASCVTAAFREQSASPEDWASIGSGPSVWEKLSSKILDENNTVI